MTAPDQNCEQDIVCAHLELCICGCCSAPRTGQAMVTPLCLPLGSLWTCAGSVGPAGSKVAVGHTGSAKLRPCGVIPTAGPGCTCKNLQSTNNTCVQRHIATAGVAACVVMPSTSLRTAPVARHHKTEHGVTKKRDPAARFGRAEPGFTSS